MKNRYWLLFICLLVPGFCDAASTGTVEQASVAGAVIAKTTSTVITEKYVPQVLVRGKWGTQPGEFGLGASMGLEGGDVIPDEMIVDNMGNIYVLDLWNNRVQKFTVTGEYSAMYPLESFIRPTHDEYLKSTAFWNKRADGFIRVLAKNLAWINNHLYVTQVRMPDVSVNKNVEDLLILQDGRFVKASNTGRKDYTRHLESPQFDRQGNQYVQDNNSLKKVNSEGKKIFEHKMQANHKYGRSSLNFNSTVSFSQTDNCFVEMKVFSNDSNDWSNVYLDGGGGMQIIRWCKK